ncbi:ABC transporter permease [Streptomyces sp. AD681]|uniref:ABC transporter permease n=1 Tax=Streptomyces sp. AD681 TaxID=3019069 RepID=UPI0022F1BD73|nr:ABC transporter permease [Streptomyces sp. AD681]MDA5147432.1 ABC transporter permease [Streptomyces sp. AD681]
MSPSWEAFRTGAGFALLEHSRNRLALILVVCYIPIWLTLEHWFVTPAPLRFLLRTAGRTVTVNGNHLTMVSGAINTVTLVAGFMMFMPATKSLAFDRRLALAGYPRTCLLAGKITAMMIASALIAAYATAVVCWHWNPERPALLALGLFTAALSYGGIGIMLGAFLRNELAGLFIIIMASLLDTMLQNPMSNAEADKSGLQFLPEYGPTQVAVAAAFTSSVTPYGLLLLGPAWFLATWLLGMAAFFARTRNHLAVPAATLPGRTT